MHRVVKAVNPDLATFVEFDQEWRKLPLPGSGNGEDEGPIRDYALAPGGNVMLRLMMMVVVVVVVVVIMMMVDTRLL